MVYGERGDTGKRWLKKIKKEVPEENVDDKAETNKVSVHEVLHYQLRMKYIGP